MYVIDCVGGSFRGLSMKLKTVKNIVIALFCAAAFAGNVWNYARPAEPVPDVITFYDVQEPQTGLLDINSATEEELTRLPGIGPYKARAIIEYRQTYGAFVTAEEIMEVRGIGQATYDNIKDLITAR